MKVMIFTGKFGMGHYTAATTLAEQIACQIPGATPIIVDIYELAYPQACNLFYQAYATFVGLDVAKGSHLYNFAYSKIAYQEQGAKSIRSLSKRYLQKCMVNLIETASPDVLVSTYSLCSQLLADYKRQSGSQLPLVTCITDISSHSIWTNCCTDLYLVASEFTKQSLIKEGIAAEHIVVSGIPVRDCFKAIVKDKDHAKSSKELLVMGGGLGLLPKDDRFYETLNAIEGLHTTVIAGKNKKLLQKLRGKYQHITVLGYSDRVAELMQRADLILTKPGGISMFEAIHAELPLLLMKPSLEQEIHNANYLLARGMAVMSEQSNIADVARVLLQEDQLLSQMRAQMHEEKARLQDDALISYLTDYRGEAQSA